MTIDHVIDWPASLERFGPQLVVLDRLQRNGIISDLCVRVEDVAHVDRIRALRWLEKESGSP